MYPMLNLQPIGSSNKKDKKGARKKSMFVPIFGWYFDNFCSMTLSAQLCVYHNNLRARGKVPSTTRILRKVRSAKSSNYIAFVALTIQFIVRIQ